jgi:hypothetical protein
MCGLWQLAWAGVTATGCLEKIRGDIENVHMNLLLEPGRKIELLAYDPPQKLGWKPEDSTSHPSGHQRKCKALPLGSSQRQTSAAVQEPHQMKFSLTSLHPSWAVTSTGAVGRRDWLEML